MVLDAFIFDLDGTLVDSAEGILTSFAAAFASQGLIPTSPLTTDIIGPPLMPTLKTLTGSNDPAVIQPLANAFKAHYDTEGFKLTRVFDGVEDLLAALAGSRRPLWIATNKRHLPTARIIAMLGWDRYFRAVYSLDTVEPALANKGALIRHLLSTFTLPGATTLYVGDRNDDGVAAAQAGTPFFHATWGYEGAPADAVSGAGGNIAALLQTLNSQQSVA
jgi:phosphoglycolate phosphatase